MTVPQTVAEFEKRIVEYARQGVRFAPKLLAGMRSDAKKREEATAEVESLRAKLDALQSL